MSDREAKLAAFLAKDEPPARDYLFEARLAIAASRHRVAAAMVRRAPWMIVALAIVWAAAPGVAAYVTENASVWASGFAVAVLASSFMLIRRQFVR